MRRTNNIICTCICYRYTRQSNNTPGTRPRTIVRAETPAPQDRNVLAVPGACWTYLCKEVCTLECLFMFVYVLSQPLFPPMMFVSCCKFGPDDNDLQILNKWPRTEGKTRNSVVQAGSCSPREKQSAPIAKLTLASAESNLKLKESQRLLSILIVIRLDYPIDGGGG
jgi:hypothetical protein